MAPLLLEGNTLGERQKHYNKILKKTLDKTQSSNPVQINIEDKDIQNLFKIDIASSNKNVEYILEVLKSEDMLYVSRAIKRCTWLITDPQHAHIVNPDYLHTQMFPQMTAKARNKLMLHIKLNLRDETRVEDFYNHFKNKNQPSKNHAALRWLPYCSVPFIEREVESHQGELDFPLLRRLCKISFSVLEIYLRKYDINNYFKAHVLLGTKFLIHTHTEQIFDILETFETYQLPNINAKITNSVMRKCSQKILNNFPKYCRSIDLKTFAKYLKKENIITFLLKFVELESMKSWFTFDNLKHFIKNMPKEGRFHFLKTVFIERTYNVTLTNKLDYFYDDGVAQLFCARTNKNVTSSANIYLWYQFAPFDAAFPDLKKLLQIESSAVERNAMLGVLVTCAGRNLQHIHTLLQYYHDKHINEPFKFKIQFVNIVLSQTAMHLFDDKTWSILNIIFCSMEVYTESENNVQYCIQAIILYKVLHDEKVPEIVEKKFAFDTLKSLQIKLTKVQKDKMFTYLFKILVSKIENKNIHYEVEFAEALQLLEEVLNLLIDWNRDLQDYPLVIQEIKKLNKMKICNSWAGDLSTLYNKNKSWRKHLFEDSLTLSPKEEACVNALKHDPKLLERHRSEVEALCRNDRVSLDRLLSKLRIYWPESLARQWTDWYLGRLDSPGGHKALVRGLCALLPQMQLLDIVKKYAPTETKINWSEDDDIQLNLRKQFAKNLYLARPLPSPETVLLYARGDYLQFALPSLNALLYNLSPAHSRDHIAKFLDAPVSLQKHGIRLAFSKLESRELKKIFSDIWKSTKNSSIRAVLFKQTYDLLCKEKNSVMIEEIWELLNVFIDNLGPDEDKTIFGILGEVDKVPLVVRAKFSMKSYRYLKSLPAKANCQSIENIVDGLIEFMELLDSDFVAELLQETLDKEFAKKRYARTTLLSSYLLCAKDTTSQTERYEKLLSPLLKSCFDQWKQKVDGCYLARYTVTDILEQLSSDVQMYALEKKMILPVKMFEDIQTEIEGKLLIEDNYLILRSWKLTVTYVKLLEGQKEKIASITVDSRRCQTGGYYFREFDKTWNEVYLEIAPQFAEICIKYLKEDIESYFSSIYLLYAKALKDMISNMEITQMVYLETLKYMLEWKESTESYLVVLNVLPEYFIDEETAQFSEIRKKIALHPSSEVKMHYYDKYRSCDLDSEN